MWRATRRLFTASSFLVYRLTGEYVLDHHSASQWVPLYDVRANAWIDEWAPRRRAACRCRRCRRCAGPRSRSASSAPAAAAATGLPAGIPVAAGTIDSLAEIFGAGVRRARRAAARLRHDHVPGRGHDHRRVPTPASGARRASSPASRNLAAGTATAGALAAWVRELCGAADFAALTRRGARRCRPAPAAS